MKAPKTKDQLIAEWEALLAEAKADHHAGRKASNPQGWADRELEIANIEFRLDLIRERM